MLQRRRGPDVQSLYSITTAQEAMRGTFRKLNRYVGNMAPMPGVYPTIRYRCCGQRD